jgi:hypothetical protein
MAEENHENLNQYSQFLDRHLELASPEHKPLDSDIQWLSKLLTNYMPTWLTAFLFAWVGTQLTGKQEPNYLTN